MLRSGSLGVAMGNTANCGSSSFESAGRLFMVVDRNGHTTYFWKEQSQNEINKILEGMGVLVRVREDMSPHIPSEEPELVECA